MPRIEPVGKAESRAAETVFGEIETTFGSVPNLFRTYAHSDGLLRAQWRKVRQVMFDGTLPRALCEAIALVVSADNRCEYCVTHHGMALRALGWSTDGVRGLIEHGEHERLDARDNALVALARAANRDARNVPGALYDHAREAGAGDTAIVEALAVMETFAGLNRFIDAAGVALES